VASASPEIEIIQKSFLFLCISSSGSDPITLDRELDSSEHC
jgi:hypothetical protein